MDLFYLHMYIFYLLSYYVRRYLPCDLQERAQLAQGPGQGLREHPHRPYRFNFQEINRKGAK